MSHSIQLRGTALSNARLLAEQPQPIQEIVGKISSIDAREIGLIGAKIIEKVVNNLGPLGKACVALELLKKGAPESYNRLPNDIKIMFAKRHIEPAHPLFQSDTDEAKFMLLALWPVTRKISDCFSTPLGFLRDGLVFKVSDEPTGFIKETARQLGITITLNDIPAKYYVTLKVDTKLPEENSDLVFVLTEESEGVEFSKMTFTIKELTQEMLHQLMPSRAKL